LLSDYHNLPSATPVIEKAISEKEDKKGPTLSSSVASLLNCGDDEIKEISFYPHFSIVTKKADY